MKQEWHEHRTWQLYQAALQHNRHRLEVVSAYCDDVVAYILANCIVPEDIKRIVNDSDWEKVYVAALVPQIVEELMAEKRVREGIKTLWFLAAVAAHLQETIFPNWLTPDCPRVRITPKSEYWRITAPNATPISEHWTRRNPDNPPVAEPANDIDITVDIHRFGLTYGLPQTDGWYDIGVYFHYLGPFDPEYEWHERPGFGVMYYWIYPWPKPKPGVITAAPYYSGRFEMIVY